MVKNKKKIAPKKSRFKFPKWLVDFAIATVLLIMVLIVGGCGWGLHYIYELSKNLPSVMSLKEYRPSLITELYDDDGERISQFYVEKRILLPIAQIPSQLINATIAVEDSSFYEHGGINIKGILRAALKNILAGGVVEGGSTITQQLTKTMFLSPERTIERKLKEVMLAQRIEANFSKQQILEIYLNQIYYGHGAYGVEAAAGVYFGKGAKDLKLEEIAVIVALPKAPRRYSPYRKPALAKKRRNHVLKRMATHDYISFQEANLLSRKPIVLKEGEKEERIKAPFFTEYIRQYLEKEYGSRKLYRSGLKVYTTLKLGHQLIAEEEMKKGLENVDRRLGYRGPLGNVEINDGIADWEQVVRITKEKYPEEEPNIDNLNTGTTLLGVALDVKPELVIVDLKEETGELALSDMSWAHARDHKKDARRMKKPKSIEGIIAPGDIIRVQLLEKNEKGVFKLSLVQDPVVQGALVCLDASTGFIRAMVGGYDFTKTKFNRAVQAKRQPGSAFKPLIYSAALAKKYTPASIFIDSPLIFEEMDVADWKPENFEKRFYGPITLRTALIHSRNVVTVKLLKKIGIRHAVNHIKKFMIHSKITPDLSMALGTSSISPLELTSVYGVFANKGVWAKPMAIKYITDSEGNLLEKHDVKAEQIISEENAYITASILRDVVQHGTGRRVKVLNRPIGAKTGTTNDFMDAWFIGFTPRLVTGVWVGMDYNATLGINETGSRAASPIWLEFMKRILEDEPVKTFSVPQGIVYKRINGKDGLLTTPEDPESLLECFIDGTAPTKYSGEDEQKGWKKLKL